MSKYQCIKYVEFAGYSLDNGKPGRKVFSYPEEYNLKLIELSETDLLYRRLDLDSYNNVGFIYKNAYFPINKTDFTKYFSKIEDHKYLHIKRFKIDSDNSNEIESFISNKDIDDIKYVKYSDNYADIYYTKYLESDQ